MTALPLVSMLWEPVEPAAALSERFGFADVASTVGWMTDALWNAWGVVVRDCERLVISDRNLLAWITTDGVRLVVKWSVASSRFRRLADTASLVAWLGAAGVPVAAPIPASDGRLRVELDGVSLGVCPVVDGGLLDVDHPGRAAEAGRMLARLHEVLTAYPGAIDGRRPGGGKQLVHNDFRSANILHDGACITAVLDFEDVAHGTRAADLAKAAVLLGTRYHDWRPTGAAVREAFLAAYHEQAPLSSAEQHELQRGVAAVLAHFGWE